jgi:hypothetical protein
VAGALHHVNKEAPCKFHQWPKKADAVPRT